MRFNLSVIVSISLLTVISCSKRNDSIFEAFDELHYIILFENGNNFELLYKGWNTANGKYSLKGDTILLRYDENQFDEFNPNRELVRVILIEKDLNRVKSIGGRMPFCANIILDKRK